MSGTLGWTPVRLSGDEIERLRSPEPFLRAVGLEDAGALMFVWFGLGAVVAVLVGLAIVVGPSRPPAWVETFIILTLLLFAVLWLAVGWFAAGRLVKAGWLGLGFLARGRAPSEERLAAAAAGVGEALEFEVARAWEVHTEFEQNALFETTCGSWVLLGEGAADAAFGFHEDTDAWTAARRVRIVRVVGDGELGSSIGIVGRSGQGAGTAAGVEMGLVDLSEIQLSDAVARVMGGEADDGVAVYTPDRLPAVFQRAMSDSGS
ncbi:MAG: hypothetical protein AAF297_00350 [Planctomycetota bacterium]